MQVKKGVLFLFFYYYYFNLMDVVGRYIVQYRYICRANAKMYIKQFMLFRNVKSVYKDYIIFTIERNIYFV